MLQVYTIFGMIIVLVLIIIWVLYSNIEIEMDIKRVGQDDEINVFICALNGLLKYHTKIPFVDLFDGENGFIKAKIEKNIGSWNNETKIQERKERFNTNEIKLILKRIKKLHRVYWHTIKYIYQKIIINKVIWKTSVGTDDAAYTAILVGMLWGVKSNLIMLLKNNLILKDAIIDVNPNYNAPKLVTTFNCIVNIKIGYIIIAGIKFLLIKFRGGEKIERASN
ncbi:MAG: DUF2953 domain-containing protein [Clostridiaceae bacterium]|nr:DUF2953 domain-containing protein [Clostridiaceae bacterium]